MNPNPQSQPESDSDRLGYAVVITVSDTASAGQREDLSGPEAARILGEAGFHVLDVEIVPDERTLIQDRMRAACDREGVRLVVTTGGTGLSPRDVTPEATRRVIDREVPGLALLMRLEGIQKTPRFRAGSWGSGARCWSSTCRAASRGWLNR